MLYSNILFDNVTNKYLRQTKLRMQPDVQELVHILKRNSRAMFLFS